MNKSDFEPPKLPIAWIAATFVAPTLIVLLPQIFTSDVSLPILLIMALALLSVLLLIVCFALVVRIYNESYKTQIAEFKLEQMMDEMELLQKRLDTLEKKQRKDNSE